MAHFDFLMVGRDRCLPTHLCRRSCPARTSPRHEGVPGLKETRLCQYPKRFKQECCPAQHLPKLPEVLTSLGLFEQRHNSRVDGLSTRNKCRSGHDSSQERRCSHKRTLVRCIHTFSALSTSLPLRPTQARALLQQIMGVQGVCLPLKLPYW